MLTAVRRGRVSTGLVEARICRAIGLPGGEGVDAALAGGGADIAVGRVVAARVLGRGAVAGGAGDLYGVAAWDKTGEAVGAGGAREHRLAGNRRAAGVQQLNGRAGQALLATVLDRVPVQVLPDQVTQRGRLVEADVMTSVSLARGQGKAWAAAGRWIGIAVGGQRALPGQGQHVAGRRREHLVVAT